MKVTKGIQYSLMAVAIVGAFIGGNLVVKWYQTTTPEAREAASMLKTYRPGFELPDLAGKMRNLDEWNGNVVVVNFWATWCPPCRREMPDFIELQAMYGSKGLQFIGIALDEAVKVENFIDSMGVEYPILIGGNKAEEVSAAYGNRFGALPYTALVNRDGMIVATFRGEVSRTQIESLITEYL